MWALAGMLILLGLRLVISTTPAAHAAGSGQIQQKLSTSRQQVTKLSSDVAAARDRVSALNAGIASLTSRLAGLQDDLSAKRNQLLHLRAQLTGQQSKLAQLEATVSADLLERLAFARRIGRQDARITGNVSAARSAVSAEAIRLGTLSGRATQLAEQALTDRNQVAMLKLRLVSRRLAAARAASVKSGELAGAKSQVTSLVSQLAKLQAAQSGQASQSTPGSGPAPRAPVSRGFEFPMPKTDVSPPATWSLDDGVDIAAPGGTPELAVCSGTLVLHGIGGFGPSTPVLHCDSPLAGYDYVYYGHAGPGHWTPIGTHVAQGQVISEVGDGIVGISSGPHLEIGFADASGSPIGPSSAPGMMRLLRSAYGA
jgi:murein DD-endopeptidase MepM/ murein hydrolase activator NlpD